jgi:hypothetical protein
MLKRLVREPLAHFLLIGGLMFLWSAWQGGFGDRSTRIVVARSVVEQQSTGFVRTWGREPSGAELKGLIDDHVKEEIAAREALAMGLEREDTVIRRRLRQKIEFLLVDETSATPATDADLQAWLARHPEAFRAEPQVAFRQVFVRPERRGASARADAERLLARLRAAGPDATTDRLGDVSMLPADSPMVPLAEVVRAFGQDFADELVKIQPGRWQGPVESTFGLHLVLVRQRRDGAAVELAAARPLVERELQSERRAAALQALYDRLLAKYDVTVEAPAPVSLAAAQMRGTP